MPCLIAVACGGESVSGPPSGGGASGSGGTVQTGGSGGSGGGECPPGAGARGGANGACTLGFVGSGKLPDPLAPTSNLTGPSAIGLDDGFLIAYREQAGDALRVSILGLSDSGTAGAPDFFDLGGCANVVPTDGTGARRKFHLSKPTKSKSTRRRGCGRGLPANPRGAADGRRSAEIFRV